jgi:hypothetical protein
MRITRHLFPLLAVSSLAIAARSGGGQPTAERGTKAEPTLRTLSYDVRDLIVSPATWNAGQDGRRDPAQTAALLVQALVAALEPDSRKLGLGAPDAIQVVNGTRLVVRATAAEHARLAELLQSMRRIADVAVIVQAQLYEVDDAFHTRLKKVKRISLEEAERRFLHGPPQKDAGDSLFKLLEKAPVVVRGEPVKADNGQEIALLSRQRAVICLPTPDAVRLAVMAAPQTILEGLALRAAVTVSSDRRSVRVKLVEKSAAIQDILKVKTQDLADNPVDAEVAFVLETTQSQVVEIPDSGSMLVAVHYRPASLRDKDRWWVLSIACRIWIDEEEREIRRGVLASVVPALVADVLNNPRLKSTREFYGSPGDARFALVNGDAWTWPADAKLVVAGHEQVLAQRDGKRLLGIRIDDYDREKDVVSVTLVNAGGVSNGAVVGSCALRYTVQSTAKGWSVALDEP